MVDQAKVDHAFRQFVFESLKLRGTDSSGNILNSTTGEGKIVWDDPYPLFVKQDALLEISVPVAIANGKNKITLFIAN